MSSGRLAEKRVLITGTGSGQGEAAQRLFADEGARIIGCDFQGGRAESTAAELGNEGFEASGRTVDLSNPGKASNLVGWGVDQLGGLDVLCNNARKAGVRAVRPNERRRVGFHHSQWARSDLLRHLTRLGGYHRRWRRLYSQYRFGRGFARCRTPGSGHPFDRKGWSRCTNLAARRRGAPAGIRANSISPGFVASPGTNVVPQEVVDFMVQEQQMLHRAASPADIAGLALFLASDAGSFVTGSNYAIDGGWGAGVSANGDSSQ